MSGRKISFSVFLSAGLFIGHVCAQSTGATFISKADVAATVAEATARIKANESTISDLVIRHIDVGEENLGVSVVQRVRVAPGETHRGISHLNLDEIYYVISGEGTMITGGQMVEIQSRDSTLLGPMEIGTMTGGVLQKMKPGDIAIIPKGMAHGWHEIVTDSISYLIFRGDPDKVMSEK